MALLFIHCDNSIHFTIFSDSLSGLQSISNLKIENSLVLDILKSYSELTQKGKSIVGSIVVFLATVESSEMRSQSCNKLLS